MKTIVLLAMHGAPPNDFPQHELAELMGLHARLERAHETERAALQQRHDALDARLRGWPRTAANDPFYAGSQDLAAQLRQATGLEVILGFNEFCAPSLDEAFDQAAALAPRVVVVTPMMTRGGEHSEVDIPHAIRRAQERHPGVIIRYAWPLDSAEVARFLASQIDRVE